MNRRSLNKLSSLVNQPLLSSNMLSAELSGVIDELDRLSVVETIEAIVREGPIREVGDFIDEEKKVERVRFRTREYALWKKALSQTVVTQNITQFTPNLALFEPEEEKERGCGKTNSRERNGNNWK